MIIFLVLMTGIIVSVMNIFNSQLSQYLGVYLSTVLIHFIGLVTFVIVMIIKKEKINISKQGPWLLYTGGMIGVLTVVFNVISIQGIGAALVSALSLFGQILISLLLENKGWLGTKKHSFHLKKIISLFIIVLGIGVMML